MAPLDPSLETLALMQPGDDGKIDLLATLLRRPAWMAEAACAEGPVEPRAGMPKLQRPEAVTKTGLYGLISGPPALGWGDDTQATF